MKNNLGFWRSNGAPDLILSIIENGYRLPFISFPLPVKLRNNKSARIHGDFFLQPCGKKTLIFVLLHVSKSLIKKSVKYQDWKIAMSYFAKDAYMFSLIKKAGITISILHKNTKLFWGFHF